MCGITGYISFRDNFPGLLAAMTARLQHRGPDGNGNFSRQNVHLGHRRLSIIDLESGNQPMSNEDDTLWVTFNGEIYNYRELKILLEAKNHIFKTKSDTEIILHAYEEWGEDCVSRFRGMFAFGLADFKQQRLFLARDHLGIKPLFYISQPGYFAFASEIQALKEIPSFPSELDYNALDQYLTLQYIHAPGTIYRHIRKLSPATSLLIPFTGPPSAPRTYWDLCFNPNHKRSETETLEQLEEVLLDSVKTHLVSDVPFGAFLSGGIDSTLIVYLMSKLLPQPVKTFTIGFKEKQFNELSFAETVAKTYQTEHHTQIVKPDALSILPRLVRHYGEPFGDVSAIPTYYVSKMARAHVPMVLSGDGGDEAFAGYSYYQSWQKWLNYQSLKLWKRPLHLFARLFFPKRYERKPTLKNWNIFSNSFHADHRKNLWKCEYKKLIGANDPLDWIYSKTAQFSNVQKIQYLDLKSYLPSDILTKVDIASMIHGLEVRTPFVDVKVMEMAMTIPEKMNFSTIENSQQGKFLLKKILSKSFPRDFLYRPKQGFSVPIGHWFKDPSSVPFVSSDARILSLFNRNAVDSVFNSQNSQQKWILLVLEEWLKQNQA